MKKIRIHISNFRHLYPVTFLATSLFSVSVTAQLSDTVQTEELFSDDAAVKFIMELKERRGLSTALADLIHNYSLCVREELGQLIERENKGKGKAKGQTKPGLTAFDV